MQTTVMDALSVLRMATIEGAKALGIDDITGSIEKGKKADIIVVDCDKPHMTPMYNPFSHLVYAACGEDVSYSIINGRVVMDNRRLVIMDIDEVMNEARKRAKDILQWLPSSDTNQNL
jgi:5-methylthioadenosine/S-adenosylhomocysteine deaminase